MKDNNVSMSYSTKCQLCGDIVRWSDNDPNDDQYSDLYGKLKYHLNNGPCPRNEKIKEVLGIKSEPNCMAWFKWAST